jgi:hypothetical protein
VLAFAHKDESTKPIVGFGDPVFDPAKPARALEKRRRAKSRVAANTAIDRTNLAQALPSLPRQAPTDSEQWQSSWPRPPGYSSRQGRQ